MSIEWKTSSENVLYPDAVAFMEARVADIYKKDVPDMVWALEHPALYTAGTSANAQDLLSQDLPVFQTGRGGQYTYHGPGQRIYYIMLNLKEVFQAPDIKIYIWMLEESIIQSLEMFNIKGERRAGRVGIWVVCPDGQEKKIAAIGVRVRHWVAYHGISVNLSPDLGAFSGIVPCGISEHGVTSFKDLGVDVTQEAFDNVYRESFLSVFNLPLLQG